MQYVRNVAEVLLDEHRVNTSASFLRENRRHFFLQEAQTEKKLAQYLPQETCARNLIV